MWKAAEIMLAFVGLYPIVTAALWMAGGLLHRMKDEVRDVSEPEGGWPGVSLLIPAYNEAAVIATSVAAARSADYPNLERSWCSTTDRPTAPRRPRSRRPAAIRAAGSSATRSTAGRRTG
jgi:biofilm PGA synthesis N-glycosyltransferase PgaC